MNSPGISPQIVSRPNTPQICFCKSSGTMEARYGQPKHSGKAGSRSRKLRAHRAAARLRRLTVRKMDYFYLDLSKPALEKAKKEFNAVDVELQRLLAEMGSCVRKAKRLHSF